MILELSSKFCEFWAPFWLFSYYWSVLSSCLTPDISWTNFYIQTSSYIILVDFRSHFRIRLFECFFKLI